MIEGTTLSGNLTVTGQREATADNRENTPVRLASKTPPKVTIQERLAYTRLDRVLSSGEPLRDDVPRGYYLDITV